MKTLFSITMICGLLIGNLSAQTPDFSPNHDVVLCGPNDVYFVCIAPDNPQNIWWDFGDGSTSSELSPSHFYITTGVYDVKLVVEKNGVKDSIVKVAFVTVKPIPEAKFVREIDQVHEPFKREFKFTGFSNSDSMQSYEWKINDTLVATTMNLTYTFPRSDWFVVSLDIVNNRGCSAATSDSVYIRGQEVESGLNEKTFAQDFQIGLSPDQNLLSIHRISGIAEKMTITVYDITGKIEFTSPLAEDQKEWKVDVSSLYPGLHLIVLNNKSYVAVKKMQKIML
jgi:PKD repeat protein